MRITPQVNYLPFPWYFSTMSATIDNAGRIVIPKSLRERAGLTAGTRVDFHYRDGHIEIAPIEVEGGWERYRGIDFPIPPGDAPDLTVPEIREAIEDTRESRLT
jgi:AbrB family looped-hinge helix DNA binding protein